MLHEDEAECGTKKPKLQIHLAQQTSSRRADRQNAHAIVRGFQKSSGKRRSVKPL